jgi:hypothetical protein
VRYSRKASNSQIRTSGSPRQIAFGIAYNLASALRQLDQLVEAAELLERVGDNPDADPALRNSASTALADITPRIGHLRVFTIGRQAGDIIAIDTHPLPEPQLEAAFPIDPGTHIITAERGGQTLHSEPIVILEGSSREVTLPLASASPPALPPAPRAAAMSVATPTPLPNHSGLSSVQKSAPAVATTAPWWLWAGAGALVVGAVAVAAVAASNGDSGQKTVHGDFDPPVLRFQVGK